MSCDFKNADVTNSCAKSYDIRSLKFQDVRLQNNVFGWKGC